MKLTDRQTEILSFVLDFHTKRRIWPTVRDVSEHFSIRISAAAGHLVALEKHGALIPIRRKPGGRRSGWLLPKGAL